MRRASIVFCILGLLMLSACVNTTGNTDVHVETISVPIEGVDDTITASGYIEMFELRHPLSSPPIISFHPYPRYFHLFPFAVLDYTNIPVFSLTNSAQEIFELLGINREDISSDRFGNQQINNVTAVFDNFITQNFVSGDYIFESRFVSAEIIDFVNDGTGDFWEIATLDFILFTNGDRTIEPVPLRVGGEFLGFSINRIESSQIYMKNGEIYHQLSAEAEVSGQIALGGDVTIGLNFDSEYRIYATFTVSSEYLPLLPRIADFVVSVDTFTITNAHEMMLALGVTRGELDTARNIDFEGVSAVFDISWVSTFGYTVTFVEIRGDIE